MDRTLFRVCYAGHPVTYSFTYPGTRYCFRPLPGRICDLGCDIMASKERIEETRKVLPPGTRDAYVEYRSLIGLTALELLRYRCCIFHAVSFVFENKAFLLTGPSGIGKTTQYKNWQQLFPGEISMICGDMPLIELREDHSIWAHPTSWNGKENIGSRNSGPVCGIVLLEQGKKNTISRMSPRSAVMPFFEQFIVRGETEEQIEVLCQIMDRMLRNVPCFKYVNRGDLASTKLLRETLHNCAAQGGENGTL